MIGFPTPIPQSAPLTTTLSLGFPFQNPVYLLQQPIYAEYAAAAVPYVVPLDYGITVQPPQALFNPLKFVFLRAQAATAVANAGHLISITVLDIASYTQTMSDKGAPYGRSVVDTASYTDSVTWR